jgi:hypothetical protein
MQHKIYQLYREQFIIGNISYIWYAVYTPIVLLYLRPV